MQFRDHPGVQGKRDAYPFDPRLLKIEEGYNPRDLDAPDERDDLNELKESIRANGVRVPLEVRLLDDDVFVIAGHRRHKAVMELIAEGEPIKAVPVIPEPKHTSPEDRIINLVISNSGKPLKPLEIAEVVRRLVAFGWERQQVGKRLGKSASAISGYLDMIAMPEPVKEHVREGDISATEAAKLVKTLPKGTDPIEAAKLIAANKEENKKLGIGKKNGNKVTAATLKRDKPKAPEPKIFEAGAVTVSGPAPGERTEPYAPPTGTPAPLTFTPLSDEAPPAPVHPQLQEVAAREVPAQTFAPPSRMHDSAQKFFAIIARLATIGEGHDLNAIDDDHVIEVPAEVIKAADRAYRDHIGDA